MKLALAIAICIARPALAEDHVHRGFYFEVDAGPSAMTARTRFAGSNYAVSSAGLAVSAALGGAVSRSLVVFGVVEAINVYAAHRDRPPLTTVAGGTSYLQPAVSAVGAGAAYYLPSDVFVGLSATLSINTMQITTYSMDTESLAPPNSGLGVGAIVSAGKQWWVTPSWSVGVTGKVFVGSIPDGVQDRSWASLGGVVGFAVSHN